MRCYWGCFDLHNGLFGFEYEFYLKLRVRFLPCSFSFSLFFYIITQEKDFGHEPRGSKNKGYPLKRDILCIDARNFNKVQQLFVFGLSLTGTVITHRSRRNLEQFRPLLLRESRLVDYAPDKIAQFVIDFSINFFHIRKPPLHRQSSAPKVLNMCPNYITAAQIMQCDIKYLSFPNIFFR